MSVASILQVSLRATKPACASHCTVLGMLTAFFMLPQAYASVDDLRIQSELGQKFRAYLRLSQRDLSNEQSSVGNYGSDCFRATMRSVDGNLIANLAVERNGSGLNLQSPQIIEEPASRVSVRNICPEGGSREFAVLLDPTQNGKLAARNSKPSTDSNSTNLGWVDSRVSSLNQSAAQARLGRARRTPRTSAGKNESLGRSWSNADASFSRHCRIKLDNFHH